MTNIIIANIIAFIASLLMVYTGIMKKKSAILFVQTIQMALFVLSNLILGGITGAIINAINCIRNILCYKDKLGKFSKPKDDIKAGIAPIVNRLKISV